MALDTFQCNYLTPVHFRGLKYKVTVDIVVWTGIQITVCWHADRLTSRPGLLD